MEESFKRLVESRVWHNNVVILNALYKVFCALIIAGHQANALFRSAPEFFEALIDEPYVLAGEVIIDMVTLQLMVDLGLWRDDMAIQQFILDQNARLMVRNRLSPGLQNASEFWQAVFDLRDEDFGPAFFYYNQLGGQHQPADFYEIIDEGQINVRRFHARVQFLLVQFRNVEDVQNFPVLLHDIFGDLVARLRQQVSFKYFFYFIMFQTFNFFHKL